MSFGSSTDSVLNCCSCFSSPRLNVPRHAFARAQELSLSCRTSTGNLLMPVPLTSLRASASARHHFFRNGQRRSLLFRISPLPILSASVPVVGLKNQVSPNVGHLPAPSWGCATWADAFAVDGMCCMSHQPRQDGFIGLQSPLRSSF